MAPKRGKYRGRVEIGTWAPGTKSEHHAVCLLGTDGQRYRLRRVGGNALRDAALHELVGKLITADAHLLAGSTLLLSSWVEDEESG
jgi:hypothetical protein